LALIGKSKTGLPLFPKRAIEDGVMRSRFVLFKARDEEEEDDRG
jgi:hypothetical protein